MELFPFSFYFLFLYFGRRGASATIAPAAAAAPTAGKVTGDALYQQVVADDKQYLLQNYGTRAPVVFTHGKGTRVYDTSGELGHRCSFCIDSAQRVKDRRGR